MLKTSCNIARLHILTKEERETGYVAYSVPRGKDPGRTCNNSHGKFSICQMVDSSQPYENSACRQTQPFAADETAPAPFNSSAIHRIHFPTADIPQKFSQSEGNHIIKDTDPESNPFFHCRQWLRGVPDGRSDNHCNDATTFSHRKFQIVENTLSTCERPIWPMSRVNCSCSMENSRRRWFGVHEEQLTSNLPRCLQVGQACSISEISSESIAHMTPSTSPQRTIHCQRQDSCPRSSRHVPIDMLFLGSSMPECVKTLNNYPIWDMKKAFTQPESSRQGCVKSATSGDLPKSLQVQSKTAHQSELGILNSDPKKPLLTSQKLVGSDSKLEFEIGNRKDLLFKQPQEGHKWALRELEFFVRHFPRHLPVLTSPVIAFLRKSKERDLLRPLRVIFPMAAEKVLSSLCATVIARNYLLSILQLDRQRSLWKCHKIPTIHRAATKAGDDLAAQSPLCSFDQDGHIPDPRSAKICLEIDKIICHLIFTIVGRFDKNLKSTIEVLVGVLETDTSK